MVLSIFALSIGEVIVSTSFSHLHVTSLRYNTCTVYSKVKMHRNQVGLKLWPVPVQCKIKRI